MHIGQLALIKNENRKTLVAIAVLFTFQCLARAGNPAIMSQPFRTRIQFGFAMSYHRSSSSPSEVDR